MYGKLMYKWLIYFTFISQYIIEKLHHVLLKDQKIMSSFDSALRILEEDPKREPLMFLAI